MASITDQFFSAFAETPSALAYMKKEPHMKIYIIFPYEDHVYRSSVECCRLHFQGQKGTDVKIKLYNTLAMPSPNDELFLETDLPSMKKFADAYFEGAEYEHVFRGYNDRQEVALWSADFLHHVRVFFTEGYPEHEPDWDDRDDVLNVGE